MEVDEEEEDLVDEGPPPRPTLAQKAVATAIQFGRLIVAAVVGLSIIGTGEMLPPLRRLDAALFPHRPTLKVILVALLVLGFATFMGGCLHLAIKGGGSDEITFGELKHYWRSGTWRDSARIKRFFVIGGGAFLAITAAVALGVVFAKPGLKLLVLLAWSYAAIRIFLAWRAAPPIIGSPAAGLRRPFDAGPRARS